MITDRKVATHAGGTGGRPPAMAAARRLLVGRRALLAAAAFGASNAHAMLLSGEALDTAANVLSWVVLFLVPAIGITVFWIIHVLPEKIAHKRHHPQRQAIQTLCLLSLVFGGLLWPIAWLWAYTRPVGYKLAYGTDKHEDYFEELGEKAHAGTLVDEEIAHLRNELEAMHARGALPAHLTKLREDVAVLAAAQAPGQRSARTPVAAEGSE